MRVVRLLLLGLLVYLVSVMVLFPAAPVVERVRGQLPPFVELGAVRGKLYRGSLDTVRYTDDLLPLAFRNVTWRLAPGALLRGGVGAKVGFEGYGGRGDALVARQWNGDIKLSDALVTAQARELEVLLPAPIARFTGTLTLDIESLVLKDQLLEELNAVIEWRDAVLEAPLAATLGTLSIDVKKTGEGQHTATLQGSGGDLDIQGTVQVALNGDFTADVLMTPQPSASAELLDNVRRVGRPADGGAYQWQQSGNLNRLM